MCSTWFELINSFPFNLISSTNMLNLTIPCISMLATYVSGKCIESRYSLSDIHKFTRPTRPSWHNGLSVPNIPVGSRVVQCMWLWLSHPHIYWRKIMSLSLWNDFMTHYLSAGTLSNAIYMMKVEMWNRSSPAILAIVNLMAIVKHF